MSSKTLTLTLTLTLSLPNANPAKIRQNTKLSEFRSMMREAAEAGTPIQKIPLVMETSGAYGSEMQNWWKDMVKLEGEVRGVGTPRSLQDQGLLHTWSANIWSTFQRQKLSMGVARMQAEGIIKKISQNGPLEADVATDNW